MNPLPITYPPLAQYWRLTVEDNPVVSVIDDLDTLNIGFCPHHIL
jgi:hypothetical protein